MDRPAGGPVQLSGPPLDRVQLPAPARPRTSVVVLAYRSALPLYTCLTALARQRTADPFETLVVMNGASDDVREVVDGHVTGARVLRSAVNLGFGGGCNLAATRALGEHLVFLNDDTEVDDGWLQALVDAADAHPEAGAVGSRITDPVGRLQEAGGILWSDGTIWHVGRLLPETTSRHRYLRAVDYCSACSLLVRRTTFEAAGGFDDAYFPGYYEDLDLCLSIRALGARILYQPRSRLCHQGGGDVGSLDLRAKAFVAARSRQRFMARWGDKLGGQPPPPDPRPPAPGAIDAVERAMHLARHLPHRCLVVGDHITVDDIAPLAPSSYAATVSSGPLSAAVQEHLGDLGAEVLAIDLRTHLAGSSTLYDVVVVAGAGALRDVAPLVRAHQPLATLVYLGRTTDDAAGEADALMPSLSPEGLDVARRRRLLATA